MAGPTNADLRKQITSLATEKANLISEVSRLNGEVTQLKNQLEHERRLHKGYSLQHEKLCRAFDGSLALLHFFTTPDTAHPR
jgi:hypothetical protein